MAKPALFSGIQPTGRLHIGNYLGALKNFVDLQNSGKYQCYFCIVDLHALTENPDTKELNKNITGLASDFWAAGLDPKKSVIFQQSQVPAHSELTWIFNTIMSMGELLRMTQFKDKTKISDYIEKSETLIKKVSKLQKNEAVKKYLEIYEKQLEELRNIANVGIFDYPVLMAADILLYDAQFVPVGDDQLQHLELTRTLARKFNAKFGKTFIEPKALLTETPRVMSLKNPTKKMSKSQPDGCLFLDDSPEDIKTKLKSAVTDSGSEIKYDPNKKPAIANLLEMYASLSDDEMPKLEKKFKNSSYSDFKKDLAELFADYFADFRKKKKELMADSSSLTAILKSGSEKAAKVAEKKIEEVKEKVGLV